MTKYKPILKGYKECFNKMYSIVQNPNLPKKDNIQNTFNYMALLLKNEKYDDTAKTTEPLALKALIEDMNGNIPHYFIKDNSLVDFLKNTTVKDCSIVKDYIYENSKEIVTFSTSDDGCYHFIAVHSEVESHLFAYLFSKERNRFIVCPFFDTNGYMFDLDEDTDLTESPVGRMAVNFIYYINAFPNKVLDGVPNDMVKNDKPKYVGSNNFSIGIAEEIVEKSQIVNGRIVSPHFRSGFFRHYTSDRYTNMKGKVQFIAGTMVKAKAKTVVA